MQMERLVNAINHLQVALREIKEISGAFYVSNREYGKIDKPEFHINWETLLSMPIETRIKQRDDVKYPYEIYAKIDGIKFFDLLSQGEYNKLPATQKKAGVI